ncbi:MAG: DUF1638 domain-containing protein [Opitutaceae bacterium]|nr:DUF1638 domain-containing protein [Opitutaceae bacterium]
MNAYERVMNTLQGLPVDRVPVFAVLSTYGGKLTGTDLRTLYSDASAYVAGQCAVQDTFGLDLVLAPFDYSAIAEAFGGEVAWFTDQAPNLKRPATRTAAEALALPLPDPHHTGRLPVSLEAVRRLAAIYQGRVPVFAAIPGPGAMPTMILGLEAWLEIVLFDEPAARRILEWSGRFFVDWANALLAAGATGLVVTEPVAALEIMPRTLFAKRFLPHLHTQFAQVRGPIVLHHTGGRIAHVLDLLPGLPGLVGVVIGSKDDLGAARRALGPGLLLLGNLDNLSLPTASAAEIRAQCLACLREAAPAGRYILSHSAADVPLSTPPENVRAMLDASVEYASAVAAGILPAAAGGVPAAPASPAARTDTAGRRPRRQARTPAATTTPSIPAASATPTQLDPAIPAASPALRQAQTPAAADPPTVWLCCGVLRAELEALHHQGRLGGELRFLDSMLHMSPPRLQANLETALGQPGSAGGRLVLVYGDCCSRMLDLVREYRVGRVNAINCAQMLVGRARYRELMHEQAFMLLPEWAHRWREIMRVELGLSPEVARDLMRENRREIVYLDTGLAPVPHPELAECAAYTGLPCRIEPVALDHLLALLLEAESAAEVRPLSEGVR